MPATLSKMAKPTPHCWFIARLRRLMFACSLVSHTMRPMALYCRGGAMQWPQHSLAVHGFTGMRTVVGAAIPSYAWSLQFKAQIGKNRAISSDELENSTKRVLRRKLFEEKEKKKRSRYIRVRNPNIARGAFWMRKFWGKNSRYVRANMVLWE